MWNEIIKGFADRNIVKTMEDCQRKIKEFKELYKRTVDHNKRSGNNNKECMYYEVSNMF